MIAQLRKIMVHYGCNSNLGVMLRLSLGLLLTELGVSSQPLLEDFNRYKGRVTWTWLVSVWEKCHRFGIKVQFEDMPDLFQREKDGWFMAKLEGVFAEDDLIRINRFRLHQ